MRLKGSEDEIQDQFSVSSRSLFHLFWLLVLNMVSHRLDAKRSNIQLPCLKLGLPRLLDLVPEQKKGYCEQPPILQGSLSIVFSPDFQAFKDLCWKAGG